MDLKNYICSMPNASVIGEKLSELKRLSNKNFILIDDLDAHFRPDIIHFLVGETLAISDGKQAVPAGLYHRWLDKLVRQGFDNEIAFTE